MNFNHNIIYTVKRQGKTYLGMRWCGISSDGQYIFKNIATGKHYNFLDGDGAQFIEFGDV